MRRSRRGAANADSRMGLSFLDVLSNALGVAILLFIILSSLRSAGEITEPGGEHFIRLKWTVFDPKAIMQAWIAAPGGDAKKREFFELEDRTSGSRIYDKPYAKGQIVLFGFTERGGDAALLDGKSESRVYIMRIQSPLSGTWRVGALYVNRADALAASAPETVRITLDVQSSSNPDLRFEKLVSFADEIEFTGIDFKE